MYEIAYSERLGSMFSLNMSFLRKPEERDGGIYVSDWSHICFYGEEQRLNIKYSC